MSTYVALFRGINVGGNHILPMKSLTALLEELGCRNVKTYIQSGNVVFDSDKKQTTRLGGEIGSAILQAHGFKPKMWLMKESELLDAIDHNPFNTEVGKALHFFFLESEAKNADLAKLKSLSKENEEFKLHKKVFYLYAPDGIGRSKLVEKMGPALGVDMTARNWNTVSKLLSMIQDKAR